MHATAHGAIIKEMIAFAFGEISSNFLIAVRPLSGTEICTNIALGPMQHGVAHECMHVARRPYSKGNKNVQKRAHCLNDD